MNLALWDVQSRSALPEHIQYELKDEGLARCVAFNRRANLLAVGCSDGRAVIWDFNTRGIAKVLVGHVQTVTSVYWSKNSRNLITGGADGLVNVWDVLTGKPHRIFKLEAPIVTVELHPKNQNYLLVCSMVSEPFLFNIETSQRTVVPCLHPDVEVALIPELASENNEVGQSVSRPQSTPLDRYMEQSNADLERENGEAMEEDPITNQPIESEDKAADQLKDLKPSLMNYGANIDTSESKKLNPEGNDMMMEVTSTYTGKGSNVNSPVAVFDPSGLEIYVGDARAIVTVISLDLPTNESSSSSDHTSLPAESSSTKEGEYPKMSIKSWFRTTNANYAAIKRLVISNDKKFLLINSADRVVRMWNLEKNEQHKELLDAVNRQNWKVCCFSADQEHVLAGSSQRREHKIYIWDRQTGSLLKFLDGPNHGVIDILWHPTQPVLISVGTSGIVYVWGTHHDEVWSCFAPGFIELEENEEYLEREDEFDIQDDSDDETSVRRDSSMIAFGKAQPPPKKKRKIPERSVGVDEDELIDIETVEPLDGFESDSEITDELFSLPAIVIPDKYLVQSKGSGIQSEGRKGKRKA